MYLHGVNPNCQGVPPNYQGVPPNYQGVPPNCPVNPNGMNVNIKVYHHDKTEQKTSLQTATRMWTTFLGLALFFTLLYGIAFMSSNTITQHMKDSNSYRIILSTWVILQLITWGLCIYAKSLVSPALAGSAFVALCSTTGMWIGLSMDLTTNTHYLLTGLFVIFFLIMGICIQYMLYQNQAVLVARAGITILFVILFIYFIMYLTNTGNPGPNVFILEHVIFMVYTLVFTLFFWVHTLEYWDETEFNFNFNPWQKLDGNVGSWFGKNTH